MSQAKMISSTCGRVYVHGDCFRGTNVSVVPFLPHRYSWSFQSNLLFTKPVCRTYISYASSLARTVLVYLALFGIKPGIPTRYEPSLILCESRSVHSIARVNPACTK